MELPAHTKSNTDSELPIRVMPYADKEEPKRPKLRIE
jgi:hypothetical protein